MPATVGQAAAPYPLGGDIPDGPAAFLALAQRMIDITDPVATIADLPASGNWTGRTKTVQAYPGVEFQWNGAAWKAMDMLTFATLAALATFTSTNPQVLTAGASAYVTAIQQVKYWNGTTWKYTTGLVPVQLQGADITNGTIDSGGRIVSATAAALGVKNAFSAEFERYRLLLRLTLPASGNIAFRLAAAGVDAGTNYNIRRIFTGASSIATDYIGATTQVFLSGNGGTEVEADVELHAPFLARSTRLSSIGASSGGSEESTQIEGIHSLATSYDGFSLTAQSPTQTPTYISAELYGYSH